MITEQEITTQAIKYSLENHFENAQAGEIMRAFEDGAKWAISHHKTSGLKR